MNDNIRENKKKKQNKQGGSYFIIAQILSSLAIIFGLYFLKNNNPDAYSEIKSWYNHNINYKNFDADNFKAKAIDVTNKISDSVCSYTAAAINFFSK